MGKYYSMSKFGERIRALKGTMPDNELAAKIGVAQTTFSGWLNRPQEPKIKPSVLVRLAEHFNISVDELLEYRPPVSYGDIISEHLGIIEQSAGRIRRVITKDE